MAFPKKPPKGKEGEKYLEELKTIRRDLENLKELNDKIKDTKALPPDMLKRLHETVEQLKSDTSKLNKDFPDMGFKQ